MTLKSRPSAHQFRTGSPKPVSISRNDHFVANIVFLQGAQCKQFIVRIVLHEQNHFVTIAPPRLGISPSNVK